MTPSRPNREFNIECLMKKRCISRLEAEALVDAPLTPSKHLSKTAKKEKPRTDYCCNCCGEWNPISKKECSYCGQYHEKP